MLTQTAVARSASGDEPDPTPVLFKPVDVPDECTDDPVDETDDPLEETA